MKQVVTIEPYNEEWKHVFLRLSKIFWQKVGSHLEEIEHVAVHPLSA